MKNIIHIETLFNSREMTIDWSKVYQENLPKVFHYFCYKVGSIPLAEDLTATVFEKAWKNRDKFDPRRGNPAFWLLGIARHTGYDHFRKPKREIVLEGLPEFSQDALLEDEIQKKINFQTIVKLLQQFPLRERELITLKYGADLSNQQIAHLTGLSESNVSTILNRVIDKLKREWERKNE